MDSQNINEKEQCQGPPPELDKPNAGLRRDAVESPGLVVPRRLMTAAELEELKPVITRLYIDEGRTFQQVQKYLRTHHHYNPT